VASDRDTHPILRIFGEELWIGDDSLRTLGMTIPVRMTVIRLGGGQLFLHSPLAPSPHLRAQLDALGRVGFVVAPNRFHHLFAADYGAYPEARVYLAPGLEKKRKDLDHAARLEDGPEPPWAGEIDQTMMAGIPLLNEVVFFHRRSRTLILTDLALNIHHTPSQLARGYFRITGAYGRLGQNRLIRLLTRDRRAARQSVEHMLQWDIERILMAHGDPVARGGKDAIRTLFAWLLK
jgi:hypothetical protein